MQYARIVWSATVLWAFAISRRFLAVYVPRTAQAGEANNILLFDTDPSNALLL